MSLYLSLPIYDQIQSVSGLEFQTNLGAYVSNIVSAILIVAGLAAFALLVWGGFTWIISNGDKTKVEEARNRITNALIGLAIVAASWAIFLLVDYFFGLNLAQ